MTDNPIDPWKQEALARALEHHQVDAAHGKDKATADSVVSTAAVFERYLKANAGA